MIFAKVSQSINIVIKRSYMNQKLFLSILLISMPLISDPSLQNKKAETYVKLVGREIQGLDGIPNALDGEAIRQILLVRAKIKEMLLGQLDKKTKTRTGKYLFSGNHYDMNSLVKFEDQLIKEYSPSKTKELLNCLEDAKKEFLETTLEFMARIAWTKSLVTDLIKKSFTERKIKKSLCFEWIDTPVGKETEVFATKVKTLKEFDIFLNHVNMFLGDLIFSCPKAFTQFKQKYGK